MKSGYIRSLAGLFIGMAGLLFGQSIFGAVLTHRYSFDSEIRDQVPGGGADGVLSGNAYVADGSLVLDGKDQSYLLLPENLFTNYDAITFEMWYSDSGTNSAGCALFYFGGSSGIGFTLSSLDPPPIGGTNHLVWTLDNDAQLRIYINGILASTSTNKFTPLSLGPTSQNYVGSSSSGRPCFSGKIMEFRTYSGVMSPLDVAVTKQLGPDQLLSNPGAPKALHLSPFSFGPGARVQPSVLVDFENVSNVNVSATSALTFTSDNPSVVAIDPDNRVRTVAVGTANLTVTFQGMSDTQPVVVALQEGASLIHRYSFSEGTNDWVVHDSVGTAHGRVIGGTAPFTGNGQLGLNVSASAGAYVTLPSLLISSQSEISIEAWIARTRTQYSGWERIFDFGSDVNANGDKGNYIFLAADGAYISASAPSVARMAVTTNAKEDEFPLLSWTNALPKNTSCYVAATYSPARGVAKFYVNGQVADAAAPNIPLGAILDIKNYLGKSQYTQDPFFVGYYDEFRIYSGLLHDTDIANNYAAGPNAFPEPAPGPEVSTLAADASCYKATLKGAVNPNGLPTTVRIRYGNSADYTSETAPIEIGAGHSLVTFSAPFNDLTPQTTYHFQCVAVYPTGTNYGADVAFTTPDTVETVIAAPVGMRAARLKGLVSPGISATRVWFEYGLGYNNFEQSTPPIVLEGGLDSVPVSADVSGLVAGRYYTFRVVAENDAGTRRSTKRYVVTRSAPSAQPLLQMRATPELNTLAIKFIPQFGASYVLQRSTNLINWLDLMNVDVYTNATVELLDTNSVDLPASFYRLRSP